jgi:hypothetical protein
MTISRTLSRRLERLEEEVAPLEAPAVRVWQIFYVDSDGSRREGERIEWSPPRTNSARQTVPAFRKRYR